MTELFLNSNLGNSTSAQNITELFSKASNWDSQQRIIFQLARLLPAYPLEYKTDNFLVNGCESSSWITFEEIDGQVYFLADSDSRVFKGLLVILLTPINGTFAKDFSAFEQNVYLSQLGLDNYLNSSQMSDLVSIEDEIKTIFQGLNFQ